MRAKVISKYLLDSNKPKRDKVIVEKPAVNIFPQLAVKEPPAPQIHKLEEVKNWRVYPATP